MQERRCKPARKLGPPSSARGANSSHKKYNQAWWFVEPWGLFLIRYVASHSTGFGGRSFTSADIPSSKTGTTVVSRYARIGSDWTCMAFWTSSLAFRAAATSAGSGAWTCAGGFRRSDGVARIARVPRRVCVCSVAATARLGRLRGHFSCPGGFAAASLGGLARRRLLFSTLARCLGCGRRLGDVRGLLVVGHFFDQFCLWKAGSWSCQLSALDDTFEPYAGSLGARSFKSVPGACPSAKARRVQRQNGSVCRPPNPRERQGDD